MAKGGNMSEYDRKKLVTVSIKGDYVTLSAKEVRRREVADIDIPSRPLGDIEEFIRKGVASDLMLVVE